MSEFIVIPEHGPATKCGKALAELQQAVGGPIEFVRYDDHLSFFCHEEGLFDTDIGPNLPLYFVTGAVVAGNLIAIRTLPDANGNTIRIQHHPVLDRMVAVANGIAEAHAILAKNRADVGVQ